MIMGQSWNLLTGFSFGDVRRVDDARDEFSRLSDGDVLRAGRKLILGAAENEAMGALSSGESGVISSTAARRCR